MVEPLTSFGLCFRPHAEQRPTVTWLSGGHGVSKYGPPPLLIIRGGRHGIECQKGTQSFLRPSGSFAQVKTPFQPCTVFALPCPAPGLFRIPWHRAATILLPLGRDIVALSGGSRLLTHSPVILEDTERDDPDVGGVRIRWCPVRAENVQWQQIPVPVRSQVRRKRQVKPPQRLCWLGWMCEVALEAWKSGIMETEDMLAVAPFPLLTAGHARGCGAWFSGVPI